MGIHLTHFTLIPLFLDFINVRYLENKGIRARVVCIALATKGALKNKIFINTTFFHYGSN